MYSIDRLTRKPSPSSTIDQPLDHLIACHQRIEERLEIMERAVAALEANPEEAAQAFRNCFRYFETSGSIHTADEEQSIFPRMAGRLTEEEQQLIDQLERQHHEAEELYAEVKRQPTPDNVARFCTLYRSHISTENEKLVAAARRVLQDSELVEISEEMRRRRSL